MTDKTTKSTVAGLATAGHQILLDTLMVEMGALKAILPGNVQYSHAGGPTDAAARLAREAEQDAMFDNMPV